MLKTYVMIAWRTMKKNSLYTAVNCIGLAGGLTFVFLISAYIWGESQVNHRLQDFKNQYILQSTWKNPDMGNSLTTLGPLAKALKDRYPFLVGNYYRFDAIGAIISRGTNAVKENIAVGDSTLFTMYGFRLVKGNKANALNSPFSAVVSVEKAVKFFGTTDVLGKTITVSSFSGKKHDFRITGLIDKPFRNSVMHINDQNDNQIFVSTSNLKFFARNMDWSNPYIISFIKLQNGIKPADLELPIKTLVKENTQPQVSANLRVSLQPLSSYYLDTNAALVRKTIEALGLIAAFILFMAVINFVNMLTSQANARLREISIRKVLGTTKKQLLFQYLTESILIVFFSTIIGLISFTLLNGWFGRSLLQELPALQEYPAYITALLVLLVLCLGVIAGIYPAMILSSRNVVEALKGKPAGSGSQNWVQIGLIGFQFSVATLVFVCAFIITEQVHYFFTSNLGYNKAYVLSAAVPRDYSAKGLAHMENLRKQLGSLPQVSSASLTYSIPDGGGAGSTQFYKLGADSSQAISGETVFCDEYYLSTYGIAMDTGTFFGVPGTIKDSLKMVVNQSAARSLGWNTPALALGKKLKTWGDNRIYTIAGIMHDFNFGNLQAPIKPLFFMHLSLAPIYRFLAIKVQPGNVQSSITAIHRIWSRAIPGAPFEYIFQDETLQKMYSSELQLQHAVYIAGLIAVVIVLIGIVGLVSHSIQKRTKEIGVRKVLGASVLAVIGLFLKKIVPVTIIGATIACPLAYAIMHSWLENYAYKIDITVVPFIIGILCLVIMTIVLIFIQTLKAALSNPVTSLRTE